MFKACKWAQQMSSTYVHLAPLLQAANEAALDCQEDRTNLDWPETYRLRLGGEGRNDRGLGIRQRHTGVGSPQGSAIIATIPSHANHQVSVTEQVADLHLHIKS